MKISAILLASGQSKRFGSNKLLWNYREKPLFLHTIEKIIACKKGLLEEKILVTCYEEIKENRQVQENFKTIWNEAPYLGISYSISQGILHADEKADYLFLVCDQPFLRTESIENLIKGYQNSGKGIACLSYQGRRGNPVIFSNQYREKLLELRGDVGGKTILKQNLQDLFLCEIKEEAELKDMDYHYLQDNFAENQ